MKRRELHFASFKGRAHLQKNVVLDKCDFGTKKTDGTTVSSYSPEFGHWYNLNGGPYGDDPKDQMQIKRGFEYYDKKYDNLPEQPLMGP